jgi:spore maturation protein CgeB
VKVLYIGSSSGTSLIRYQQLAQLGHETQIIDPYLAFPKSALVRSWSFRTGAFGLEELIERYVLSDIAGRYDLILVDNGELIGRRLLQKLRAHASHVSNINYDNPYCNRDGRRWRLFLQSLPFYDIAFTCRDTSVTAAIEFGARRAERIWHTVEDALIDPTNHPTEEARERYRAEVAFVGTWMPERGPFLLSLVERGVPVRIFGPRWDKAPEYRRIKDRVTLGPLDTEQYKAAVAASKVSIGLTSTENLDFSTHRSMEIPILGSVLCCSRTPDHLRLYRENEEAVFFSDADECADTCLSLMADPIRREGIRDAGRRRNIANGHFHRQLMRHIVNAATGGVITNFQAI